MTEIQYLPLSSLQISPRNARRTGGEDIDDLAASIAAEGLLQNLIVSAADGDTYHVEAGGRRLRALQQLQREDRLPDNLQKFVPCRISTSAAAGEASLAENVIRVAMHPADEFTAFDMLFRDGKSVESIAERFGKTTLYVRQRLKLANIAPDLFEAYRTDADEDLTVDCLMAMSLTDNHELQRQAWETLRPFEKNPTGIRNFLTRGKVRSDTGIGAFVGVTDYVANGGNIERDLFSDVVYLLDRPLLDTLALDKLEAKAQALRDVGWSWAEARLEIDRAELESYSHAPGAYANVKEVYASDDDEKRDAEIQSRFEEIEDIDADELDDAEKTALEDELRQLDFESEEIHDRMIEVFPAGMMGQSGAIVTLNGNGTIDVKHALLRPGEKPGKAKPAASESTNGAATTPATPKPAELSETLRRQLSVHRSEAARVRIAEDPTLALCLLLSELLSGYHLDYRQTGVGISYKHGGVATQGGTEIDESLTKRMNVAFGLAKGARKLKLTDLLAMSEDARMRLLAVLVASSFDGASGSDHGHDGVTDLHQLLGFDMADHWTPTTDNFLGRLPGALVTEAVTEAKGKDAAATLAGLKKDERTATAAKLLAGTGWLPKPLRGPTYGRKAKPAAVPIDAKPKSKAKPAKKAAAKKTAKKKPAAKKVAKAKAGVK